MTSGPWPRWGWARFASAIALCFLSGALLSSAQTDEGVNVCPTAHWLQLPFLKAHTSTATILTLVDAAIGGGDIMTAGVAYLKTNLVPKIGANVFFLALAIIFTLVFILWRFTRWCCNVVCCSSSCDAHRSKNDPYELLFTGRMTAHKFAMFLFGLGAIVLYIYGMAGTSKTVVTDAFATVDTLDTYLQGAVSHINDLVTAVGGVNTIIDDLQSIVRNDINVAGMEANMTAVKSFLAAASPATLASSMSTLDTHLNTDLPAALTALSTSLTAVAPASALVTALTTMVGAPAAVASMTASLTSLNAAILALDPTGSGAPSTTVAPLLPFSTAVLGIAPGIGGAWATTLDAISAAVDTLDGLQTAANPLTIVNARMGDVVALTTTITGSDIVTLAADITTISGQYSTVEPALSGLVAQLEHINSTVMELNAPMVAAYDSIKAATAALASFFASSPTPAGLAATLTTSGASLAPPAGTTTVRSGLTTQAAALDGAQFDATPPASDGAVLKAFVTAAKASISAVSGAEWTTMANARTTYFTTATGANYDALKNAADAYRAAAATTTMRNKLDEQDSSPCEASDYSAAAPAIAAAAGAAYSAFPAFVTSAQGAIAGLPSLGGYSTAIGAVALPPLTVFDAPQAALDSIDSAVIAGGDTAKSSIATTLASFSGATGMLQTQVLGKLDMVQTQIKPTALKADQLRYQASMAIYALPMLLLLILLFCALLVNFHFGTNLTVLLVLILLILGFLLAVVIALVLALLSDVCPAVEPILISKVPANMAPLASYYFGGSGAGVSVKTVLKDAGIVDVDTVLGQVTSGQGDVISGITANYTFRAGPTLVLERINNTVASAVGAVDALLDAASYDNVFPVYASVKGLLCCTLPDSFSSMWTAFTIGGMLAWFLILVTFFYIGKLDRLPRTDCCGCSCHTRAKYAGTVAPGPMRMVGFGGWAGHGHGGLRPITGEPSAPPQQISIPIPHNAGWEDGHVVAELVVRPPGGMSPAKLE